MIRVDGLNRVEPASPMCGGGWGRVGPSGMQTGAGRVGPQGHRGVSGAGRAGRVHMAALLRELSNAT